MLLFLLRQITQPVDIGLANSLSFSPSLGMHKSVSVHVRMSHDKT